MPLNDPVPSSALDVLKRNSEDFDKVLNGDDVVITRTGKELTPIGVALDTVDSASTQALVDIQADVDAVESAATSAETQITSIVENTQDLAEAKLDDVGFIYKDPDTFETGSTLSGNAEALLWSTDDGGNGEYYRWTGNFPKTVPANSTPASTGGVTEGAWKATGFNAVLQDLGSSDAEKGANLVNGSTNNFNTVTDAIAADLLVGKIVSVSGYTNNLVGDRVFFQVQPAGSYGIAMTNGNVLTPIGEYTFTKGMIGLSVDETTGVPVDSRIKDGDIFIDNLRQHNFHTPGADIDTHTFLIDDSKFRIPEASRSLDYQCGECKRVLFVGDSLTAYVSTDNTYTDKVSKILADKFGGIKEVGYLAAEQNTVSGKQKFFGIDITQSGFTYLNSGAFNYTDTVRNYSPDGKGITITGADGSRLYYWNMNESSLVRYTKYRLYYLQQPGGGTFDLRNRGATLNPIDTDGTLSLQTVEFDFVDNGSPLNKDIRVENVTGDVTIYGVELIDETPAKDGYTYDMAAVSGGALFELMELDYLSIRTLAQNRQYDTVVINMGTNDSTQGRTTSQFITNLEGYINRITTELPNCKFVIVTPNNMQFTNFTGSTRALYENARRQFCRENEYMYIDLPSEVGNFNYFATLGWMRDGTHPNFKGQAVIGTRIAQKLLENRTPEKKTSEEDAFIKDTGVQAHGAFHADGGTLTVLNDVGCTITRAGVGIYDVSLDSDLADEYYTIAVENGVANRVTSQTAKSVSSFRLLYNSLSNTSTDVSSVAPIAFSVIGRKA